MEKNESVILHKIDETIDESIKDKTIKVSLSSRDRKNLSPLNSSLSSEFSNEGFPDLTNSLKPR
jgi:hypothetical protein